jgi:hypothetical protein
MPYAEGRGIISLRRRRELAVTRAFPEYDGMVVTWISSCILRCETVLISAEIE